MLKKTGRSPALIFPAIVIVAAASFTGCLFGKSGGGTGPDTPAGSPQVIAKYIFKDGALTLPPFERSWYECGDGNVPVVVKDTTLPDTAFIDLRRDTLYLGLFHRENTASGAVVQMLDVFERNGSGSGLESQWTYLEKTYRVLSGDLTADEAEVFEKMVRYSNQESAFEDFTLVIADGIMTGYRDYKSAENFLSAWNGRHTEVAAEADSAQYAITVEVLDRHTVELTGAITGETVRIVFRNDGDRTYTSSVPAHADFQHHEPPETCPNDFQPNWYYEFLLGNTKT